MANKIDFSIIRERALRNIREDLLAEFAGQYDACLLYTSPSPRDS